MNYRMTSSLMAVLLALGACGGRETPDAAVQQQGIYVEGEGSESCGHRAIARGKRVTLMPVVLDVARTALVHVDAELSVVDSDGNAVALEVDERITSDAEGHAQGHARAYRLRFDRNGTYVVTATYGDGTTLSRQVAVVEQAGLRLAEYGRELITTEDGRSCRRFLAAGELPPLAANQALSARIVPVDARGEALVGELELSFAGSMAVRPVFAGSAFARYTFEPAAGEPGTVLVTDVALEQQLAVTLTVASGVERCTSQP